MKNFTFVVATLALFVPAFAVADDAAGSHGLIAIGSGIAIGLAAIGGCIGQGWAVSSALDSIGRNPSASGQVFTPMILGLALIESLVILAFVIAFALKGLI